MRVVIGATCRRLLLVASVAIALLVAARPTAAQVPTPEAHFGFRMGEDRQIASIENIERYFEVVAAASRRARIVEIGRTTEGHRTIAALISAPENIANLAEIRSVNQRFADPRTLPRDEADALAVTHKAIVAIGASIHASEIGGSQAASELLYQLATSDEPEVVSILQNVVVLLIPSLNPDGHRMIVDWYEKTRNTPFEGAAMPRLDHKYAGHDINRDGFMMNLAESRNLSRFFYADWHPQAFLSLHQMGVYGPRMFVPPVADPIDSNYSPLIWREAALLGSAMALELQRDGRRGVISSALYDYYWPGYEDSAPLGHNTVCLLAEVARANLATPITVTADDLRLQQGGPPSAPGISFPDPWPGGRWSLRDIVDYDLSAIRGLLRAASAYRQQIVTNFYEMGAHAVDAGRRDGPYAFAVMPDQFDPLAASKLEELLLQGSVEIHRVVEPFRAGDADFPAGTDLVLMAQPFRSYAKTLLERQNYPGRRSPDRAAIRPYDVTGWTLPAQMGVDVRVIDRPFQLPVMSRVTSAKIAPGRIWGDRRPSFYVVEARGNAGVLAMNRLLAAGVKISSTLRDVEIDGYRYPAGSIVIANSRAAQTAVAAVVSQLGIRGTGTRRKPPVDSAQVAAARIAVYQPSTDNADEGWMRWVLEQHDFRYTSIGDTDVRAGNLRARFDVVVLPSIASDQLMLGNQSGSVPPEYVGGLGDPGIAALVAFAEAGGTLVCIDQACTTTIERMKLPLKDVARETGSDRFLCPGSILKIDVNPESPLARGVSVHTAGFFTYSSAYEVVGDDPRVKVIARYGAKDILVSGWLDGEDVIAGRAAAVEVAAGIGRVVLLGFPVHHRGQSLATFRLLFNPLFLIR